MEKPPLMPAVDVPLRAQHNVMRAKQLAQATQGFEEVFIRKILQNARAATQVMSENDLLNSSAMEQYQGILDEQLAQNLAGDMGIAEAMTRQLMHHLGDGEQPNRGEQTRDNPESGAQP